MTSIPWRLLAVEGWRSLHERWVDRRRDAARRRGFRSVDATVARRLAGGVEVLNLLAMPPLLRLGGLPQQLLARLRAESRERDVALLYPAPRGWRLEIEAGARRGAITIAAADAAVDVAVRSALELTGARVLHVEGLAGFDLDALRRASSATAAAPVLVVSLHDLSALTERLHSPPFDPATAADLARARQAGTLLQAARVAIFPSAFLRRAHEHLAAGAGRDWRVIAPALDWEAPVAPHPRREGSRQNPAGKHLAFVGAFGPHKGAAEFEALVEALGAQAPIQWSIFGGSGDHARIGRLRHRGVRVRGYHRAGSLPRRLRQAGVDLALLLSTWPEAYGLTLDECRLAGVPVLCFDHGAMAERVRSHGGGLLVDPGRGGAGVCDAIRALLDSRSDWPRPAADGAALASRPDAAAAAVLRVYATV